MTSTHYPSERERNRLAKQVKIDLMKRIRSLFPEEFTLDGRSFRVTQVDDTSFNVSVQMGYEGGRRAYNVKIREML